MNQSELGRFITLEGIEGAGKSSHLAAIGEHLKLGGRRVVVTREPGGTALGEALRGLLLDPDNGGMGSDAELLLMFAARSEHIRSVVRPALEDGAWVVCDRFTDATYAYQGGGRGIAPERVAVIEDWVQGSLRPDLVLLLDLPVDVGLARVGHRGIRDRFEQEQAAFFERVREAYLARSRAHPERYRVVDASAPIEAVREHILDAVETFCQ